MKERIAVFAAIGTLLLSYSVPSLAAEATAPAAIAGAISDASRPQSDVELDARRKPAEMLTFAGIKPGDKVLELVPGRGYITRLLAKAVGPAGHVYAANLPSFNENFKAGVEPIIASPAYANVSKIEQPFGELGPPSRWMSCGFPRITMTSRIWACS